MSENAQETEVWKEGSLCWVEIPASDIEACKKFYSQLFPSWTFKPPTEDHPDVAQWNFSSPSGLGGGIVKVPSECKGSEQKVGVGVTVYHLVDSISGTQKRVEELGGVAAGDKTKEGENGWHMYFKDVEGNRFGVYETRK